MFNLGQRSDGERVGLHKEKMGERGAGKKEVGKKPERDRPTWSRKRTTGVMFVREVKVHRGEGVPEEEPDRSRGD